MQSGDDLQHAGVVHRFSADTTHFIERTRAPALVLEPEPHGDGGMTACTSFPQPRGSDSGALELAHAVSAAVTGLGTLLWEPLLWGLPVQVSRHEEQRVNWALEQGRLLAAFLLSGQWAVASCLMG